jgi:hypothetical protein
MTGNLLTEREVAERLRCAKTKVKRLRLSGRLVYIPGRPPLIDERDLKEYIDSVRQPVRASKSDKSETPPITAVQQSEIKERAQAKWAKFQKRAGR